MTNTREYEELLVICNVGKYKGVPLKLLLEEFTELGIPLENIYVPNGATLRGWYDIKNAERETSND